MSLAEFISQVYWRPRIGDATFNHPPGGQEHHVGVFLGRRVLGLS